MENFRHLPDGELEVMQVVWARTPPVARSEIEGELAPRAASTVLTVLSRLCEKGFLAVERRGRTNYYTPRISRRDYLAAESRSFLKSRFGGSVSALAASLVDGGISAAELAELRAELDALEGKPC